MKKCFFLATLAVLSGCGGDSKKSSSLSSDFNEAFEKLQESAPTMGSSLALTDGIPYRKTAVTDAIWANASETFESVGSTPSNPQGYVTALFDSTVDQSIFERARMPFLISCCLDILGNKTGDLFTTGSQTITFTSAVVGVCGTSAEIGSMVGSDITIVVTDLDDTSNYDQMIFMDHSTNPLFSEADQWMYVRNTSTDLNFMHVEDGSGAFDGSEISVSSISYDKSTEGGSFQFVTKDTNSVKLYRIFMDPANDDARIISYKYNIGGSNEEITASFASTFESQDQVAMSMSWANMNAPYNTDVTDGNACIDTSDVSIAADNTLTCSGNSKTVLAASTGSALATAAQAVSGSTIRTDTSAGDMEDNLPVFTAATILSAGIQL